MDAAWDTDSAVDIKYMTGAGLESNINAIGMDNIFYYHRGLDDLKDDTVVLVLIHGYPQS